ncbi:MAG: thioredoxin domain-containing protein [Neisseriaceae bacterium]|nr:thioredoxin domain-containing protein [Neisseriaceae bacterium]MBQ9724736.1 thioredoxin domain-containing protein [Neisseriaceae bacterium]
MNQSRRTFLTGTALLPLLAVTPVFADDLLGQQGNAKPQDSTLGGTIKPYLTVGNFADDKHRVFMFLSYNCPYCKETWKGIGEWGKTLPEPFKFVFVPLSMGEHSLDLATRAFYVVRDIAPHKIDTFQQIAFEKATQIRQWQEWVDILQRFVQIPAQAIDTSVRKPETAKRIERARKLAGRYRVTYTPYFGIGGRYATHVGYTNGNYQLLVQLLNALVSEIISADLVN